MLSFTSTLWLVAVLVQVIQAQNCRNVPGSPSYPSESQWQCLNNTVSGRLARAIPSGKYCRLINCTDAEWTSANWRNNIPGAMNMVNWEQDYDSNPSSLCGRISPEICGQGDVPLYAILAESVEDIQAGVNFARDHNLRLSIKASGHDYLGRSTAKNSLLIHTHKLQSIVFTDNFHVGNHDLGSAVTAGSGVGLRTLYNATEAEGKIYVGGSAVTVVAAGGYVQGGGHSPLGPLLGLAADNTLELNIVTADGVLRRVNDVENSDLFWAMRGGGAGSWGVIVNATFRTFPTFEATRSTVVLTATNSSTIGAITEAHAKHVFDFDSMKASQYYSVTYSGSNTTYIFSIVTYFPHTTSEQAMVALEPLFRDILDAGGVLISNTMATASINELFPQGDDLAGTYDVLGSRLIPESSYRQSPKDVGDVFKHLVDAGTYFIADIVVGGGQVARNAKVDNAIIPGWRTAKAYLVVGNLITEEGTIDEVHAAQNMFKTTQLPMVETIQGPNASAYSNEADPWEEDWQTVARNAKVDNAIIPGWRTAKAYLVVGNLIPEEGTIDEVHAAQNMFKTTQLPIVETIQGPNASAYSNEADPWEEDWQTVFYGLNYSRLSAIKTKYDPADLFIVKTGVGSERWDSDGLCRI
ncbi:hypothetical protein AN958_10976 [Leucoagaricus sp. SymC.cos]|nr:hypothetical protein AN958_10976 [Leucoagaricus sp. SymC.cos]